MSRPPRHFSPITLTALFSPSRLFIFITMMLYIRVGIEILKQRHLFKSIDSDYVTLDTFAVPSNDVHFHAVTIDVNVQPEPKPVAILPDRKKRDFPRYQNPALTHVRTTASLCPLGPPPGPLYHIKSIYSCHSCSSSSC